MGRRDGADDPADQARVRGGDTEADTVGQVGLDRRYLRGSTLEEANRDRQKGRRGG